MERINQFDYYNLGKVLGLVSTQTGPSKPSTVMFMLLDAQRELTSLLRGPMPLGVSRASANKLLTEVSALLDVHCSVLNEQGQRQLAWPKDDADDIPPYQWGWIRNCLATFETVFSEEMREAAAYFVPKRGIYSTPDLVDAADQTFPKDIRPFIPQKTCQDWRSAGRCLAFNLLTASGFHVARAVEGTLEAYYQNFFR